MVTCCLGAPPALECPLVPMSERIIAETATRWEVFAGAWHERVVAHDVRSASQQLASPSGLCGVPNLNAPVDQREPKRMHQVRHHDVS